VRPRWIGTPVATKLRRESSPKVRLYAFEEIDERLKLMPLAARRALDAAGLKVSLATWQRLEDGVRREIAELGSGAQVDVTGVRAALGAELATSEPCEEFPEPSAERVPEVVRRAFEDDPRLDDATWGKLEPIDRYALAKVVSRGKAKRMLAAHREIVGHGMTHLDERGRVRMVDVAPKAPSLRSATAESTVSMNPAAYRALSTNSAPKGEVLATARVAGIMAAKRTSELIPLCHPLSLTRSEVELTLRPETRTVHVLVTVEAMDRTGVEMEAMTAASVAALTVYDMLKSLDRAMTLGPCQLVSKSGGKSGDYRR